MEQTNYKFKFEYEDADSPADRYLREYKERRGRDIKLGKILTEEDKDKIRNVIIKNFKERCEEEKLTDEFIKSELGIVVKHVKNKHSHHMSSRYSMENYDLIKVIDCKGYVN